MVKILKQQMAISMYESLLDENVMFHPNLENRIAQN